MNTAILQKLGMSSKEVRLYLSLLELGLCRANTLARKIGENRTSTYSLLHSMQQKGLATHIMKRNVKYFAASDPKALIHRHLSDGESLLGLLPQLLAIHNKYDQKPKITFYEGVEGVKQICETLLEIPNSLRESFMGIDLKTIHPEIQRYFEEDFINRRIEKNITFRGICTNHLVVSKDYKPDNKTHKREIKYIDKDLFPIKIQIDIYPKNKVALYSFNKDEMMGVIIEHESFFVTMKTAFKLAWAGVEIR